LLPSYLCALALLSGPASPHLFGHESTGSRPIPDLTEEEESAAVLRGGIEHVAALARTIRAQKEIDEPAREALAALLDHYEGWEELGDGTDLTSPEIAAAFERWAHATHRLAAVQRSDALLMADRVMEAII
jgi:hypothetical protein